MTGPREFYLSPSCPLGEKRSGSRFPDAKDVDLALVLAVDVSNSIDENEFALQQSGIAAAFRSQGIYKE